MMQPTTYQEEQTADTRLEPGNCYASMEIETSCKKT